jgi:hypothetical protein
MSAELASNGRRSSRELAARLSGREMSPRLSTRRDSSIASSSSRRPVEAGGSRLPLSPSPLPPEDVPLTPTTWGGNKAARARSALKKPVWGGSNGAASKRVVYEVPSGIKPKPLLRPTTGSSRAPSAKSIRDGSNKSSTTGKTGTPTSSSRRFRSNYIPDGECRCRDCHVPHRHIVSPVDEFVKLGTLLASLKVRRAPASFGFTNTSCIVGVVCFLT